MRSPHSGLLAGMLDWGCLDRADMVVPFGAFGVGTGVAGVALGVAVLPVLGVFVCMGIGFHQSRVWQISLWCSPIVCQAFDWWILVSVCVCTFGVGGVAVLWFAWALLWWSWVSSWFTVSCVVRETFTLHAGGD